MKTEITERQVQVHMMPHLLYRCQHIITVPNTKVIYWPSLWESDLVSVTRAHFVHEYEIKRDVADYKADFNNKPAKHLGMSDPIDGWTRRPNYFWFVTCEFDIEPPEYAGWIRVSNTEYGLVLSYKKNAPRLHRDKLVDNKMIHLAKVLSQKLENMYTRYVK